MGRPSHALPKYKEMVEFSKYYKHLLKYHPFFHQEYFCFRDYLLMIIFILYKDYEKWGMYAIKGLGRNIIERNDQW
jgi:hypothetical protein